MLARRAGRYAKPLGLAGASLGLLSSLAACAVDGEAGRRPGPQVGTARPLPSPEAIRAHLGFLADDLLEGRRPGTRGYDLAARYVAAQFGRIGLTPAGGSGSFLQPVPLVRYRSTGKPKLTLRGPDGRRTELVSRKDFKFEGWPVRAQTTLTAPLAFAGFGIVAPELDRDDFAGLDVAGKIVVVIDGAPAGMSPDASILYRGVAEKRAEAAKRGAVGLINIASLHPEPPASPAASPKSGTGRGGKAPPPQPLPPWALTWRSASGTPWFRGSDVVPVGLVDRSGAEKLFQGSPVSVAAIDAARKTPAGKMRGFDLPSTLTATLRTESESVPSYNVAGLVEGSDPALRDEVIVISAHLDHLGLEPPVKGDGIFNGALDNASGVAILLEIARMLREAPPRRPVLLLALTAEESGLVGADYFVRNPTLPQSSLAANINIDMPILTYEFTDFVALGAERSTIGAAVDRAATRVGVTATPAPPDLQGDFTRSDHYRFVQQGIPSVFLRTGYANGGEAASRAFRRSCYHRACDDLTLPISYVAAARFAQINYEIARELADAPDRPRWTPGDAFAPRSTAASP